MLHPSLFGGSIVSNTVIPIKLSTGTKKDICECWRQNKPALMCMYFILVLVNMYECLDNKRQQRTVEQLSELKMKWDAKRWKEMQRRGGQEERQKGRKWKSNRRSGGSLGHYITAAVADITNTLSLFLPVYILQRSLYCFTLTVLLWLLMWHIMYKAYLQFQMLHSNLTLDGSHTWWNLKRTSHTEMTSIT